MNKNPSQVDIPDWDVSYSLLFYILLFRFLVKEMAAS